ncbi:RNA-binding protein 15 [Paragonimus heterotremus]|uniref:RNA-binding protein 15 n=1 Tax=Paragonimus heterotremus TaxID=100268 RepID=A0A8J4SPB2_9TREM|nr:RNA-binding protein 15 [Paragonimus heterotremus]
MKRHGFAEHFSHSKRPRGKVTADEVTESEFNVSSQSYSHRQRKSLLSRPSSNDSRTYHDMEQSYRDGKKSRTFHRSAASQISVSGRTSNAVSKYEENSTRFNNASSSSLSRSIFQTSLGRVDPVLAAAAAAAVLNAGLVPQTSSADMTGFGSGSTSTPSASAVAAVAAAAMNAAAMAAALGVGNMNTSSGRQLPQVNKSFNSSGSGNYRSTQLSSHRGLRTSAAPRKRPVLASSSMVRNSPPPQRRDRDSSNSSHVRFPHHLDHRNPEDDPTATRTLFVGNLMPEITEADLRSLFERYGFIEDIDIKRRDPESGVNAYAFIRFINLDMAHRAKVDMSGQLIGQFTCKIGYGKVLPTRCLWIGGLGPWITYPTFATLVEEFGPTEKIIWPSGKNYANVLFPNVEMAIVAADALRGYPLGGEHRRIRVDFTDESHMIRDPLKRRCLPGSLGVVDRSSRREVIRPVLSHERTSSNSSDLVNTQYQRRSKRDHRSDSDDPRRVASLAVVKSESSRKAVRPSRESLSSKRKFRASTPSDEEPQAPAKLPKSPKHTNIEPTTQSTKFSAPVTQQNAVNVDQLAACLPAAWEGAFFLKSSSFPCRMHMLRGDQSLVDQFMSNRDNPNHSSTSKNLRESRNGCNDKNGDLMCLRITQRMKLDPLKLEDVSQRISTAGNSGFCVLLAVASPISVPNTSYVSSGVEHPETVKQPQRPLRNLISYLRTKDSAGVVLLNPLQPSHTGTATSDNHSVTGVLHAFPPCDFAFDLLKEHAQRLQREYTKDDHLVILLIRSTGAV